MIPNEVGMRDDQGLKLTITFPVCGHSATMWLKCSSAATHHRNQQSAEVNNEGSKDCGTFPRLGQDEQAACGFWGKRLNGKEHTWPARCSNDQKKDHQTLPLSLTNQWQTENRNVVVSSFSLIQWIYEVWTCWLWWLGLGEHCVLSDKRPHGSAGEQHWRLRSSITAPISRKYPKSPKMPSKVLTGAGIGHVRASWGPASGSPSLFALGAKSRRERVARWDRRHQPPAHSRPNTGGMTEVSSSYLLSHSYLGSCPPLSPYLLALANLGWWALYKYGYRSSYQSVAGYRYGRYQLSISEW